MVASAPTICACVVSAASTKGLQSPIFIRLKIIVLRLESPGLRIRFSRPGSSSSPRLSGGSSHYSGRLLPARLSLIHFLVPNPVSSYHPPMTLSLVAIKSFRSPCSATVSNVAPSHLLPADLLLMRRSFAAKTLSPLSRRDIATLWRVFFLQVPTWSNCPASGSNHERASLISSFETSSTSIFASAACDTAALNIAVRGAANIGLHTPMRKR